MDRRFTLGSHMDDIAGNRSRLHSRNGTRCYYCHISLVDATSSPRTDPYLVVLNAMPKVALYPIIIVIFYPNISSSIAMGVIISIIITILVIYSAFQEVDSNYIKVMDTFGANKWQCYKQVVLLHPFQQLSQR